MYEVYQEDQYAVYVWILLLISKNKRFSILSTHGSGDATPAENQRPYTKERNSVTPACVSMRN
jgi:hypothetical protein